MPSRASRLPSAKSRLRRAVREALPLLLVAVAILVARSSLADHYIIPSGSMEYTLLPGDHVLVDKLAYGARLPFLGWRLAEGEEPHRGEVVIFDSPEDGTRLIKRVVAVGGDRVSLRAGELRIDGRSFRRSERASVELFGEHEARLNLRHGGGLDIAPTLIPEGRVLVVGDARGNSRDGRFFGLIPQETIYGRAKAVIYRTGEGLVWRPL
jgi:signal peptidase I